MASDDGEGCLGCGCLVIIAIGIVVAYNAFAGRSTSASSSTHSLPKLTTILEFSRRASALDQHTAVLIIKNKTANHVTGLSLLLEDQDTLNPKKDASGKAHLYERRKEHKPPPLAPHSTTEIGILETGWLLKANTVVTLSLPRYADQALYFYNDEKGTLQMALSYGDKKAAQFEEKGKKFIKLIEDAIK